MTLRTLLAPAALALALLATGCGIPLDESPRPLAASTTTTAAEPSEASVAESGDISAWLYFMSDDRLVNLNEEITSREPRDVLTALFAGVPAGTTSEIVSQIPTGTRLLGVQKTDSELTIDVSAEFSNMVGQGGTQAAAQIVMTATELNGVDRVGMTIDGQRTQLFSPVSGDTDLVTACDYLSLYPTDEVIASWTIERRAQRHLTTRRNVLESRCESADTGG